MSKKYEPFMSREKMRGRRREYYQIAKEFHQQQNEIEDLKSSINTLTIQRHAQTHSNQIENESKIDNTMEIDHDDMELDNDNNNNNNNNNNNKYKNGNGNGNGNRINENNQSYNHSDTHPYNKSHVKQPADNNNNHNNSQLCNSNIGDSDNFAQFLRAAQSYNPNPGTSMVNINYSPLGHTLISPVIHTMAAPSHHGSPSYTTPKKKRTRRPNVSFEDSPHFFVRCVGDSKLINFINGVSPRINERYTYHITHCPEHKKLHKTDHNVLCYAPTNDPNNIIYVVVKTGGSYHVKDIEQLYYMYKSLYSQGITDKQTLQIPYSYYTSNKNAYNISIGIYDR